MKPLFLLASTALLCACTTTDTGYTATPKQKDNVTITGTRVQGVSAQGLNISSRQDFEDGRYKGIPVEKPKN